LRTGWPPFLDKNHHKLGKLIKEARIIFPDPVKHKIEMSEEMKDFIRGLLTKTPSERLGANGAEEIKAHPWFKDWNWQKLEKKKIWAPYIPELKSDSEGQNTKP